MALQDAGRVAERLALQQPPETTDWLVLKEGYLLKSKLAKGIMKSTKLRWFVLKQNPVTSEARLEYYEGMLFRGSSSLRGADVRPARKAGTFTIRTWRRQNELSRTITLQAESGSVEEGTSWILALQKASLAYKTALNSPLAGNGAEGDDATAAVAALSVKGDLGEGSAAARYARGEADEIDGQAIDDARWAALHKRNADEDVSLEEDDDVRQLREMEEEEERRQEEERKAFLAEREAQQAAKKAAAGDRGAGSPDRGSGLQDSVIEAGEVSEDDEDWMEEMRKAEEEEERRQEAERQAWMATQDKK